MDGIISYLLLHMDKYCEAVIIHMKISFTAIIGSLIIAVPLGILCAKNSKVSYAVINLLTVLRIIPSLAVLLLAIPLLGTGFMPALFALTLLAIPPLLINTYTGFKTIQPAILECAAGMGMGDGKILLAVEFPLAMPLILTGLRTSATEVIASATLASYIGAGGLGDFIFTGIGMNDARILLLGGISVAVLAVFTEAFLAALQHIVTKYQRN